MTAVVLADALGPRARRRVLTISVLIAVVLAGVVFVAYRRLDESGQLNPVLWKPFTIFSVLRFFFDGLLVTLRVAAVAMVLACAVGGLLALGRLARNAPVRWVAGAYVEVFRAVPLLLLILFSALALPKYGVDLPLFWYLVMGLVAYNSAVLGEIFRAGILSLDRGQTEAAYAIGLSYWQTMLLVIVPQAVRRMVPALVSQLVTLLKDTSLGYVISLEELLRRGRINGEFFQNPLQSFFFVAIVYVVVNFTLSRVAVRLEVRQRTRYGASGITVAGAGEDLAVTDVKATNQ